MHVRPVLKEVILIVLVLALLGSFIGITKAINPPGVPHTILGTVKFFNSSIANHTNVSFKFVSQSLSDLNLSSIVGAYGSFFEFNLGNLNSSLVWNSSSTNLSISQNLRWKTGDKIIITAKRYLNYGLVQSAYANLTINNTNSGYQIVPNMTLNELPSAPHPIDIDSRFTAENNAILTRKPFFNWSIPSDVFTDSEWKDISGNFLYEVEISNDSSFNNLIYHNNFTDINNIRITGGLNLSQYTDDFIVGTYYYRIRAYDGIDWGNWSLPKSFIVKPVNKTLRLYKGYNLISYPDLLEVISNGSYYKEITAKQFIDLFPAGLVKSVTRWNASLQIYPLPVCSYVPPIGYVGCDVNISQGQGFYVEMNDNYNLSYVGRPIEAVNYSFKKGYNLLGFNDRTRNITALEYINNFFPPNTIQSITRWDPVQQVYPLPVCSYVPPIGYIGCDFNMSNGEAYFIESNTNTTLNYTVPVHVND